MEPKNENIFELKSLTPTKNADNGRFYCEVLDQALSNDDYYNIALTGGYGSGKSSVIETFINNCKPEKKKSSRWNLFSKFKTDEQPFKYNFLRISLAEFNLSKKINQTKKTSFSNLARAIKKDENDEQISLEISLLQQLIYQGSSKGTKTSHFKRKKSINPKILLFYIVTAFLTSVSVLLLINPFLLSNWIELDFLAHRTAWFLTFSLIASVGSIILIHKAIKVLLNSRISKIDLKPISLSLNDSNKISVLNEYLDEIIHIFKNDKFNVVILEDIDRLESHEIFTKLREINNLLKYSVETRDIKIKFLYAVKESIFENEKEKNKFFDVIIPIVPYVNIENSREKLRECFKKEIESLSPNKKEKLEELIKLASWTIDEMRTINNIYNEYSIYREIIGSSDKEVHLNEIKLLAIIIYKNLFPNDFELIHSGNSALQSLFNKRNDFIKEMRIEKENELEELKNELVLSKNEKSKSIDHLRGEYVGEIFKKLNNNSDHINRGLTYSQLLEEKEFNALIEKGIDLRINGITTKVKFKDIEKEVNKISYSERERIINKNGIRERLRIQKRIIRLEDELNSINNLPFSKLSFSISPNEFGLVKETEDKNEIKDEPSVSKEEVMKVKFIKALISQGYIEKDFKDFVTKFHPGSLSYKDREFLLSVRSKENLDFNLPIDNVSNVINEFIFSDWESGNYHNIILFNTLVTEKKYEEKLKLAISNFEVHEKRSLVFLNEYYPLCKNSDKLVQELIANWRDFISICISRLEEEVFILTFEKLIPKILLKSDLTDLLSQTDIVDFISYISEKEEFCSLLDDEIVSTSKSKRLKISFEELGVKFQNLKTSEDNWILKIIYENHFYELNLHMISLFINLYSSYKFDKVTYSNIKKSKLPYLIKNVDSNLDSFIENISSESESVLDDWEEEERYYLELLKSDASLDNKKKFIELVQNVTINIEDDIPTELWQSLMKNLSVKPAWLNVLNYFEQFGLDQHLLAALNTEEWVSSLDEFEDEENKPLSFLKKITKEKVDSKSFKTLMNKYDFYLNEDAIDKETRKENLLILIDDRHFEFSKIIYDKIKDIFNDKKLHLDYLLSFQDKILKEEDTDFYNHQKDDLIAILKSTKFNNIFKRNILSNITDFEDFEFNSDDGEIIFKSILETKYESLDFILRTIKLIRLESQIELFNFTMKIDKLDKDQAITFIKHFKGGLGILKYPLKEKKVLNTQILRDFGKNLHNLGLSKTPYKLIDNDKRLNIKRNTYSIKE
ncbi:MAG: hypothetical protein WED10_06370 [Brumimicrobium sp.]